MPRKSKSQATVAAASTPNEAYGAGVKAIAAQKAIPLNDEASRLEATLSAAGAPAPAAPQDTFGPALQAAQAHAGGPDALSQVQGFTEPMTSGLSTGPGPNDIQMNVRSDADIFTTMYRITGDPDLLLLAQRTRSAQSGINGA